MNISTIIVLLCICLPSINPFILPQFHVPSDRCSSLSASGFGKTSTSKKKKHPTPPPPLKSKPGLILQTISARLDTACSDTRTSKLDPKTFTHIDLINSTPSLIQYFKKNSFVLISDVPESPFKELRVSASEFFKLPQELKQRYNLRPHGPGSTKSAGYMLGTLGGKTEFLDLRFNPQTYPLKNVSPALTVLEHISSLILNPFNVTQHASLPSKTLNLTNTVLRLASYSSSTFGAHTDTTFLTIVPYSKPGLQVYTESGWFKTPQNCIVIMSGELLEYTSGIESCLHRVVSEGERLSTVYLVRQKDGGKFGGKFGGVDLNEIWAEFNPGMGVSNDDERGREENVDVNIDVILPDYEDKIYYELFGGKVLNSKPDLINFKGLLNKNECSEIRELIDTNLDNLDSRSTIVGGNQKEINDIRTSKTFWLKHNQTTTLDKLSQYISKIVGIPLSNAEKFQAARYDEGGEYGVHMDHVEEFNGLECGGRVCSFIVYLNDDFSGGSTNFPEINVNVKPVEGLGLYFRNVREPVTSTNKFNLKPDFDAIHKGSVVSNGKKYILTLWFHPVNL